MISLMKRKIYIISLCIFFGLGNVSFAQDAKLTNIIVTNTHEDLLIYLAVEGAFKEKMKKAILRLSFSKQASTNVIQLKERDGLK